MCIVPCRSLLWYWIKLNDFVTANPKKFLLFLLVREAYQEGGQDVDIFITLLPKRGFDTVQLRASSLNQTSPSDPLKI